MYYIFFILFIKTMFNRLEKNRIIDIFIKNISLQMSKDYFELPKDIYLKTESGLIFIGRGVAGILIQFDTENDTYINYAFIFIRKYYFNFFRMFDFILSGQYYKDELILINWNNLDNFYNKRVLFIPYNLEVFDTKKFIIRYHKNDFNLLNSIIHKMYNDYDFVKNIDKAVKLKDIGDEQISKLKDVEISKVKKEYTENKPPY